MFLLTFFLFYSILRTDKANRVRFITTTAEQRPLFWKVKTMKTQDTKTTNNATTTKARKVTGRAAMLRNVNNKYKSMQAQEGKAKDKYVDFLLSLYDITRADTGNAKATDSAVKTACESALRDSLGADWIKDKANKTRKSEYKTIIAYLLKKYSAQRAKAEKFLRDNNRNDIQAIARGTKRNNASRTDESYINSAVKVIEQRIASIASYTTADLKNLQASIYKMQQKIDNELSSRGLDKNLYKGKDKAA